MRRLESVLAKDCGKNLKSLRTRQREMHVERMAAVPPYENDLLADERIIWRGRQWTVTTRGIDTHDGKYWIEGTRLMERAPHWGNLLDFPIHIAGKEWVDLEDFRAAYTIALLAIRPRNTPRSPAALHDLLDKSFQYAQGERDDP